MSSSSGFISSNNDSPIINHSKIVTNIDKNIIELPMGVAQNDLSSTNVSTSHEQNTQIDSTANVNLSNEINSCQQTTKTCSYNDARNLQTCITEASKLLQNWKSVLEFDVLLYGSIPESNFNILSYIDNKYKLYPPTVYFCKIKYPCVDGFSGPGWSFLLKELQRHSLCQGFSIASNGHGRSKKVRFIKCVHGFMYHNEVMKRTNVSNYRDYSATNDRKNTRGLEGKKMPRRSSTKRSLTKKNCCPFCFQITYDNIGFYVVNGYGSCLHFGHPKVLSDKYIFPARLLSTEEKLIAKSVIDANASKGIVRNVISSRTGQSVSRSACAYLGTLNDDLNCMHNQKDEKSSSDLIIDFLKKKNYDYITLYNSMNRFPNQTPLVSDNYLSSKSIFTNTNFVIPPNEQKDAYDYAIDNRRNRKLSDYQNLLVAIAWVIQSERRLFNLFPETVFVDCVEDTNNEGRPLFTMTGCDSDGKMFTLLRAFLPNQRTWGFRWIFCHVLPLMFTNETLDKINVIISDGDSKEYTQIDAAINLYAKNITRVRCAWHAIDRGWLSHGPKSTNSKEVTKFKEIVYNCKHWLYSWTTSAVENEAEYIISKQLFEKYIFSKQVMNITGKDFAKKVLDFIRINLETVLPNMLFFKRKHLRHFDHNMNTKHEGTFCGIKYSSTPVTPNMSLHRTICTLSNGAERKCAHVRKNKTNDVLKTNTWIKLSCCHNLNLRGEQLLSKQWLLKDEYTSHHNSHKTWLVLFKENSSNTSFRTIYPLYKRVRKVKNVRKHFTCSCRYFERFGVPCRHILHVFSTFPKYKEPSHKDVSVIYWKQYMHYAYNADNSNTNSLEIGDMLLSLRHNDIAGPYCSKSYYNDLWIDSHIPEKFILKQMQCRNHDISMLCEHALMYVPSGYGVTMSQSLSQDSGRIDNNTELYVNDNSNNSCSEDELVIMHDPTEDVCLQALDNSFQNNMLRVNNGINIQNHDVYRFSMPIAKEIISHLQEKGNQSEIKEFNSLLSNFLNKVKDTNKPESKNEAPSGNLVSSNSNYVKRRKTHGTKYLKS